MKCARCVKWLPRTLFGQIALALFAGLVVVQLVGFVLLLDDRGRLNYKLLSQYAAQRMAGIATVLDDADPATRPGLVQALGVQPTTLLLTLPWEEGKRDESAAAKEFAEEFSRHMARSLPMQVLSIERIETLPFSVLPHYGKGGEKHGSPRTYRSPHNYVAQVRLSDGTIATFQHVLPVSSTDFPYRVIALLTLLGLSVTGLSVWSVRRLTRPLAKLADAASGLARNLNQPPLSESGPQEVQQAAQAFNAMQRDLKRLIDTRAQALSAVSHDLRLPITRMRLRLEANIDPQLRDRIEHDLGEMDAMIGHTLDFLRAGSDAEATVPLNLDALLDSVVEDMEELGAAITRRGKALQPLRARPHALRRCIANLLDNARAYGRGAAALSVEDLGKEVRISITDQGPGIPESEHERVFEPYFRLESSRAKHTGGTGLGLAIAKAIVESHGGTIRLSSPPGQGLTVTVVLPR